jgi:hypothetical protein
VKPLARTVIGVGVGLLVIWWSLALAFRLPGPAWLSQGAAGAFFIGALAILIFLRPFRRALGIVLVGLGLVFLWWSTIRPSNDRNWLPDVARAPTADFDGDKIVVHNIRNFDYRSETDFTERWEDRTYDLSALRGVDMFISYWGSPYIAHPVVSWDFGSGQHLAMSIETRKERGEEYSAIRGFFREYELVYIAADERDIIRVRTNYRGEDVYLYRVRLRPDVARQLLVAYLQSANKLAADPEFYNAALDNCTTGIRLNVQHIGAAQPWDYRILVNGLGDQLLYERKNIDTSMPFEQLKAASLIVDKAKAADRAPDFSQRIREGLPQPPPLE